MPSRATGSPIRAILLLAVVLRLALLGWNVASRPELFRPEPEALEAVRSAWADPDRAFAHPFGFELGSVAYSVAVAGDGFGNPFGAGTGPTAWVAPLPVALYALAFALFGAFTGGAALALLLAALAASAATVALVYDAARRVFPGEGAATAAALLAACSPWDLRLFRSGSLHDLHLPTLALVLVVALLLRAVERPTAGRLAAFGVASAAATLTNPVLALPAAACLGLEALRRRIPWARGAAAFVLAHALLVGPWIVGQHAHLGAWVFVKSNLPYELWLGSRPEVMGVHSAEGMRAYHPSQSESELAAYRREGEVAYVRRRGRSFLEELEAGPFLRATGRRVAHFFWWHPPGPWEGGVTLWVKRVLAAVPGLVLIALPLVRRIRGRPIPPGMWTLYVAIAVYAAPYLVTAVTERYVLPAIPLVLVLASGLAGLAGSSRWGITAFRSRRPAP